MIEITLKENGEKYYFACDINKNIELIGGTVAGNGSIDWSNEGITLAKIAESILAERADTVLAALVDDTAYPLDHIVTKNHVVKFIFPDDPLGKNMRHYYALFCSLKSVWLLDPAFLLLEQKADDCGFSCRAKINTDFNDTAGEALKKQIAAEIKANDPIIQKCLPYYKAFPLLKASGSEKLVEQLLAEERYDGLRLVMSGDFACYQENLTINDPGLYPLLELKFSFADGVLTISGHIR